MFKPKAEREATREAKARALQKAAALLVEAKAIMRKKAEEIVSLSRFVEYKAEEIVSEIVSPGTGLDAVRGRKARARLTSAAQRANEQRAVEAKAEAAKWKASLLRAKLWPIGANSSVKEAANHIADTFRLDPAKVYQTLRKKNSQHKL